MSVTGFKRRSKKAYFLMGTVSILVPAVVAITILSISYCQCSAENKKLEAELSKKTKSTGYVLEQDIAEGQRIEAKMLRKVSMSGDKDAAIQSVDKKELVGKCAKSAFTKGTMLNSQCVYEEKKYSSDMRIHELNFVEISDKIQTGDFVDIRISYPNGEDYIVVNHKEITDLTVPQQDQPETNCKIHANVTEEEILRLTSAYVDLCCYTGTRIYAVSYLDQFQQAGIVNYPVNPQVFQLLGWNPNVLNYVSSEQEQQRRATLEKNLSTYAVEHEEMIISSIEQQENTVDAASFFE